MQSCQFSRVSHSLFFLSITFPLSSSRLSSLRLCAYIRLAAPWLADWQIVFASSIWLMVKKIHFSVVAVQRHLQAGHICDNTSCVYFNTEVNHTAYEWYLCWLGQGQRTWWWGGYLSTLSHQHKLAFKLTAWGSLSLAAWWGCSAFVMQRRFCSEH